MKDYSLLINFQAEEKDGEALLAALVQICEAWRRHERISGVSYEKPILGGDLKETLNDSNFI